ncbi:MAG: bis(5'-nucleosyl)-tetraphosphatase (symmetrical) YqeK [Eubacteriales bacterium]
MEAFSEKQIASLREAISKTLSPKRLAHVLAVEDMAVRLGRLFECDLSILRAAALLHDNTKEYSDEDQLRIIERFSVTLPSEELACMPTIHAVTGALVIPLLYPEFDNETVKNAVRYHTSGREGMDIYEKIIFLADFIDETRKYPPCIELRRDFFAAKPENMTAKQREAHIDRAVLRSIESTLAHLREKGEPINPATLATKKWLERRLCDEA